ncbi:MAG: FAD-binding oxidoreductase [Chloroflexota bacterium]|nr:MAG: FAD-binding oxidoreductase [Chloroflexota bacterium]
MEQLGELFGNRVNFRYGERVLYSHDVAAMPGLVKPLVGKTVPEAVVQPENEADLVQLVRWAGAHGVPLTPRGKATSGYGGAVPVKKGVVVDFFRLRRVLAVDHATLTVTVEPGITWRRLEQAIEPEGLSLRLYPTSAPGSTVGGWLAQGGAGIGSYQYGWFRENVASARVVLPSGEVRDFSGEDLDLVADAEGITGLISRITLRVRPREDVAVLSVAFPDPEKLQRAVESLVATDLPIWSMVFINPRMAEMKNRAPLREHAGHTVEERVALPAAYVLTLAFGAAVRDKIQKEIPHLIHPFEGEVLSQRIAEHEWENRFQLMIVKRLGPSLVPSEVVVPLRNLGGALGEIERKVNQPIVKEGVIVKRGRDGGPEAVILGFIPSDQRRFSYNLVFGLVLTVMKIAQRYGGRPYSTGLYFSKRAGQVLGDNRVARLRRFKAEIDPRGIMNPKKVIGDGLLGRVLNLAARLESLIRPFGNHVITQIGERPTAMVRDIPSDVAWYAYSCSQCGYCMEECTQYAGRGWESQSPRGKWFWLREHMEGRAEWDQHMVDSIISCTTCELCDRVCSAALPVEPSWMKLRGQLIQEEKKMTFPPFEVMAASLRKEGDIWAGYRRDRDDWFPADLKQKHTGKKSKNVYFGGCTVAYVENDIGLGAVRMLDEAGVDYTYLGQKENCCGTPMLVAGKWDLFAETLKKNIAAVKAAGADTVVSSCPACDLMWRQVYPEWAAKLGIDYGITAKHYSELVSDKIKAGEFAFKGELPPTKVSWHDSCHIGRASGVYEPPRELIKAIPGVELVETAHNRENGLCCGSVLTLLNDPPAAHDLGKRRLDEAVDAGADAMLALCPCCQFQLRTANEKRQVNMPVHDLASFACRALGYTFPDPNPEVMRQWRVFEAMIAMMTPRGFADLMGTMWPELIDAMPMGMGGMMRAMGKSGPIGALMLTAMKPMFPILFPRLLPGMLPKVLPTMLERIGQQIPMPDYMAEQMPELMPQVMENLMPHMLPDVVPLVVDPMIAYLRGAQKRGPAVATR